MAVWCVNKWAISGVAVAAACVAAAVIALLCVRAKKREKQRVQQKVQAEAASIAAKIEEKIRETPVAPSPIFAALQQEFTEEERSVFASVVLYNERALTTAVKYPVSQYVVEYKFLSDFFRSCVKFAQYLPLSVTERLYVRHMRNLPTDRRKSVVRRKMAHVYFLRRDEEGAVAKCETLYKEDVGVWLEVFCVENVSLPPLKKLMTLYVRQKRYGEAVQLCDLAIEHRLIDGKGKGYEARKARLLKKSGG